MFQQNSLKREDSFEVIDGEGHSATPEEETSADENHTDSGKNRTEELTCLELTEDHQREAVTQPTVEECLPIVSTPDQEFPDALVDNLESFAPTTLGPNPAFEPASHALVVRSRSTPPSTRTKNKHSKQLSHKEAWTRAPRLTELNQCTTAFERKWIFPILFVLSGIILAQFFVNRDDFRKISQLHHDLAALKLDYAEALLQESKKCASQDAVYQSHLAELQAEQIHLVDELRKKSDWYDVQQEQSRTLILDLQTERLKLLDEVSQWDKQVKERDHTIAKLKEQNERLESTLNRVNNDRSDFIGRTHEHGTAFRHGKKPNKRYWTEWF